MRYLKLGGLLYLLWFILSGQTSPLFLLLGLASVLLVLWVMIRLDRTDSTPASLILSPQFFRYLAWLAGQIIASNIDVARRIWDPKLPISPAWRRINMGLKQPITKTLYANSVTLTPGTVTTEVGDDYIVVHSLDHHGIERVAEGDMEARVALLEESR